MLEEDFRRVMNVHPKETCPLRPQRFMSPPAETPSQILGPIKGFFVICRKNMSGTSQTPSRSMISVIALRVIIAKPITREPNTTNNPREKHQKHQGKLKLLKIKSLKRGQWQLWYVLEDMILMPVDSCDIPLCQATFS